MENNNDVIDPLSPSGLLADEPEEGVKYINPNIEVKLPANKRMECREIVKKIKDYGINQRQLVYLVYLLALELENREMMLTITKTVGEQRNNVPISELIIPE
jgi:hypothetical protein